MDFYSFDMKDIDGRTVSLSDYKGNVLLNRQGVVTARFNPATEPDDANLVKTLEQALSGE